ncbi:MAG: NAD-dependent epimerase/dehydratase family protein [Candidatus Kapabacteria bacterium]|nr:NAD-dependent epimerase/dehydratase family protein [Candidatus Kapabacteria bacterium]
MNHTILGAGGSIGNSLAYELLKDNEPVLLVSRSNYAIKGAESFKADISKYEETLKSVQGSDIVYLCVGLKYDIKVWEELWPKIMLNTIDACKSVNAKLIFFDNVYMYGAVQGKMTEDTPYNPCSRKGELRARIATTLENEIKKKNLIANIARSADLYGPNITTNSGPYILVIDKLMKGKNAQWMLDAEKTHSFTYTIDCAKAMKILAKSEDSFNQVWHIPTYNPGITGKTFVELVAKELKKAPKYMILKKWMLQLVGIFDKTVSEINEMLYQTENDYYFDSTKFNRTFSYQPITYEEGIHETIKTLLRNSK